MLLLSRFFSGVFDLLGLLEPLLFLLGEMLSRFSLLDLLLLLLKLSDLRSFLCFTFSYVFFDDHWRCCQISLIY